MSPTDYEIGARIHSIAWRQKISQADLGRAIGLVSKSGISYKIRGHRGWTTNELLLAARFLGVAVADFFDGVEPFQCAIRDSNPEPAGYVSVLVRGDNGPGSGW